MNLFNRQTLDTSPQHPVSFDQLDEPEHALEASRREDIEAEESSSKININMEDAGSWINQDHE